MAKQEKATDWVKIESKDAGLKQRIAKVDAATKALSEAQKDCATYFYSLKAVKEAGLTTDNTVLAYRYGFSYAPRAERTSTSKPTFSI